MNAQKAIEYITQTRIVEESIGVRFGDKLGSQKLKQGKFFADIEVQFTGTEDNASEVYHKESQPIPEEAVTIITVTSEEPFQKRQSRSILAHVEDKIMGKKEDPIRTRFTFRKFEESLMGLVSLIEPTSTD